MKFLFDIDTWQEIYGSIRKNKLRTAITIIGVTWGIFLLVVLLGVARGVDNNFKKLFGDFATNSVFIWAQSTSMPFKGYQKGRRVRLTNRDVTAIRSEIKGVSLVVPRNQTNSLVVRKFQTGNFKISGDYPQLNLVQKKDIVWGRFINENDILQKKKVCVIEEDVYKQLFEKGEYPIGQFVKINNLNFKVVGVYRRSATINIGNDELYIPFSTFQQVYNQGNKIGWMMITAKPKYNIKQMEEDIKLLLRNMHKINPEDKRAFGSFNLGEMFAKVTGFLKGMQFLTWFVGIATLIAGVFAIGNILLITVKERTKEIGIRRALGAMPIEIKRQVVLESIVLTLTAGMLGIIGGGIILIIIDTFFGHGPKATLTNPTVNIPVILIAFATLMFLGTLIGLIPAQRAVSIKPIEALREE